VYRGYDINQLAEHSTYEEIVFLLLYGKLPDHAELSALNEKLISYRHVMGEVINDPVFEKQGIIRMLKL